MKNLLPEQYFATYEKMLERIGAAYAPTESLAAFTVQVASLYRSGGLMICGRALNGGIYPESWNSGEMLGEKRYEIIMALRKNSFDSDVFKQYRSQFWHVAREVANLKIFEPSEPSDWADTICWNNLCKISPSDGGNPCDTLFELQLDDCVELFRIETQSLNPRVVIVLAGETWYRPFTDKLGIALIPFERFVRHTAEYEGRTWIFGEHPERKPISASDYASEIRRAWHSLQNKYVAGQ